MSVHFHTCNDDPSRGGQRHLINRRFFWHFGSESRDEIHVEVVVPAGRFGFGVDVSTVGSADHTALFKFCLPPLNLYWGFNWKWLEHRKWWQRLVGEDIRIPYGFEESARIMKEKGWTEEQLHNAQMEQNRHAEDLALFDFYVFEWTLYWKVYHSNKEWKSGTPRWRSGNFDIKQFFLGKTKYSEVLISERDVKIPMPEKEYAAHARLYDAVWKHSRWPFRTIVRRVEVDIPEGIPHPGKGTCEYNCGEDKLFGQTAPGESIADGICSVIAAVTKRRLTYPL